MRLADATRSLLERRVVLLGAAIALQWLSTLVVALQADHTGWRFGAEERAAELVRHSALVPIVLLNVIVIGPLALLCAYRVAASIGGVALGAWALVVWVGAPWAMHMFTLAKYDATLSDLVLPMGLGLTPEPGYQAGAALLLSSALLTVRSTRTAALGGLAAGIAALLVPQAALFVLPAALALAVWRRPRELGVFAAVAAPAVVVALVWRDFSLGDLTVDQLRANMAGLREYFWSQRVLQWLPIAGAIAVARRSLPLALLLAGWFGLWVVVGAAEVGTGYADAELFRAMLPALPAYILLAAALPLLVPTPCGAARTACPAGRGPLGVVRARLHPDALLEQGEPLRQDHVLVGELRDHRRVVEQHGEDEERRDGEKHRRWVAGDADPAGDRVQPTAPRREHEQHDAGREPEQGIALAQPPAANQLEDDEDEQDRRDRRGDRDVERGHRVHLMTPPGERCGVGRCRRAAPASP